jgi:hypothetical protein
MDRIENIKKQNSKQILIYIIVKNKVKMDKKIENSKTKFLKKTENKILTNKQIIARY